MSDFNLRDWAVGQKILATDLQAHTDRLNANTPISLTGNVKVSGALAHGFAAYFPFPPPTGQELPVLHVTGEATGSGQYLARTLDVESEWDSTDDTDGLFNEGDDDVVLVNWLEYYNDPPTHWLTHTDNTLQRWFSPARRGGTDEQGRQVYFGNFVWVQACTP